MAKCIDCLECVKMIGDEGVIFFCDVDDNIKDKKFEENHNCKSYKKDE